jgi:hypothetical protein
MALLQLFTGISALLLLLRPMLPLKEQMEQSDMQMTLG